MNGSHGTNAYFEAVGLSAAMSIGTFGSSLFLGGMSPMLSAAMATLPFCVVAATHQLLSPPKRVPVLSPDVKGLKVFLGITALGQKVHIDFHSTPHMKDGGVTGAGKTTALELILGQLVATKAPRELSIHIIDFKRGASFAHFSSAPQVHSISYDERAALGVLLNLAEIQNDRLDACRNARAGFRPVPQFPAIFLVVDEGAEIAPKYAFDKEQAKLRQNILSVISTLTRVGREPNLHVLFATQRPSDDTLPVAIRGQMDATIALRTQNELDSKIILREHGAELIPNIKGRAIFQTPSGKVAVQLGYIPVSTLYRWIQEAGAKYPKSDRRESSSTASSLAKAPSTELDLTEYLGNG